ncbi:cell division protein ZipA [Ursidibacter maritimus]|uniref:Cell division protein ZipA n=1 Tax=Ursidibacter maritimus TaxID=1331689 RepID=A0A949T4J8_9PAST|nr:cell division protein ZipA [Ursidibacter maritimus]KAE9540293.1 cell division protein ZipA [Ursidibacter maritimus]MBV6524190.1 cell division protein ZipA [Ursidibacter maritimus]MBV6525674.1 cell division protein ZipA [Ursidibacter maritimus]MBV6528163.1 cell division protein ZipA [Ursidibacter maritimus]MBV6528983.1 cell division protein ZipA [Ursidibacter maritimus]
METSILFFILAGLLIAILVGYSLWSARREKSRIFSNTFSTRPPSNPINNTIQSEIPPTLQSTSIDPLLQGNSLSPNPNDFEQIQQEVKEIKISLPNQPSDQVALEQPTFSQTLQQEERPISIQINGTENTPSVQLEESVPATTQPQIITLYVVAAEGQQFRGDVIAQQLDALGFQYGEYQIFHRHLDNSASPVLFSVANMMQPGVFDLAKMDQFSTVGLVFFMHLPSAGNDLVNVRLMIRTVESFAQSVNGFVLNEERELFDDHSREQYLLRVAK